MKPARQVVDGVLLLNKPVGITSNAALQKAKWLLNAKKAGHTGTLDPFADGLLPLCFGEATKFSAYLLDADKRYRAVQQLGVTTTTGDPEGEMLCRAEVHASCADIAAVLPRFVGTIEQIPPMPSALKDQGRPLYEYARAGIEIDRPPRRVSIRSLDMIRIFTKLVSLPEHANSIDAKELLGVARERRGQLAPAKAEYEEYLRWYPGSVGAPPIRQRLDALLTASAKPPERPGARQGAVTRPTDLEIFGSASTQYRRESLDGGEAE